METDYNYKTSRRKQAQSKNRLNLLDVIALIITLISAALLLLSYLAKHINPNTGWPFAILGLASPIFYIANIVMTLYWVLRWKSYMILPLIALVVGFGSISLFFHPSMRKSYDKDQQPVASFRVMSYNVEGFLNRDANNRPIPRMDSLGKFISDHRPDILCMQEYQITDRMPEVQIDTLLNKLPHKKVYFSLTKSGGNSGWGIAIYSRYPIVNHQIIHFDNTNNSAIYADIAIANDTVRVFNCHLQTTSLTHSDRKFMDPEEFIQSDNSIKSERIKAILIKLRNNYKIRANQADTLARLISLTPYPVIVCGDFNDTPMSYTYNRVRGSMSDSFVQKGDNGPSHTYRGLFNMFRIDYIMHSEKYETINYSAPESAYSDHKPVIVDLVDKSRE